MPRLLLGMELEDAIRWMDRAVEQAASAGCGKDRRGVVIIKHGALIGYGANGPPPGFPCVPGYCKEICSTYSVHAEMRAIARAVKDGHGIELQGSRMYHARTIDTKLADSRKPRCAQCSKHLIEFGIAEFVLRHAEGYTIYTAEELHRLSIEYVKNPNKPPDPHGDHAIRR